MVMKLNDAPDLKFGEVIPLFYKYIREERTSFLVKDFPSNELALITSLLNHKFGKEYTFKEVFTLLQAEGLV